jgi:hypothetical protein
MKEEQSVKIESPDGGEAVIKRSDRTMDFFGEEDMKELSQ